MTVELFSANRAATTVSSGGTGAPSAGTSETWTVASSTGFPLASSSASPPTQFHVADPADPTEIIAVTSVSGTTWTVTRGAESTTPVTHAAGFTVWQDVTSGALGRFIQTPSLTDTATVYVTAGGSDSNDGLTWNTAFASIPHAISALPTVGGIQMGTVEVGMGTFTVTSGGSPAISLGSSQAVKIRGRGLSEVYSPGAIGSPQYLTVISDTGTGTTISITGVSDGAQFSQVSELALSTTTAANGVVMTNTWPQALVSAAIDGYSVFGLTTVNNIGGEFRDVFISRCGDAGATTPTGGIYLEAGPGGPIYEFVLLGCEVTNCIGFGVYAFGGKMCNAFNSAFEYTSASSASASGAGFYVANTYDGNGPWTFYSCWFEHSATYGFNTAVFCSAQFFGCNFAGDAVSASGIFVGGPVLLYGCNFEGHTSSSINNHYLNPLAWFQCTSADPQFITSTGTYGNTPANASNQVGIQGCAISPGWLPQTLNSAGAVLLQPGYGKIQQVTLNASASSSSIDTSTAPAVIGQELTVVLIQGTGGSRTFSWPSNCKFAGGSAPTLSTTAGWRDSVNFYLDVDGNWWETSRSIGAH